MGERGLSRKGKAAIVALSLLTVAVWAGPFALWIIHSRDEAILLKETARQRGKEAANRESVRRTALLAACDGAAPWCHFWIEDSGGLRRVGLSSGAPIEILEERPDRTPPGRSECATKSDYCFLRVRVLGGPHTDSVGFIQKWDYRAASR